MTTVVLEPGAEPISRDELDADAECGVGPQRAGIAGEQQKACFPGGARQVGSPASGVD